MDLQKKAFKALKKYLRQEEQSLNEGSIPQQQIDGLEFKISTLPPKTEI